MKTIWKITICIGIQLALAFPISLANGAFRNHDMFGNVFVSEMLKDISDALFFPALVFFLFGWMMLIYESAVFKSLLELGNKIMLYIKWDIAIRNKALRKYRRVTKDHKANITFVLVSGFLMLCVAGVFFLISYFVV